MQPVRLFRVKRKSPTKLSRKTKKKSRILSETHKHFSTFCEETSLHGLKYVGRISNHWIVRLFWALAFVLASVFATYFIWALYSDWKENPIMMTVSSTSTSISSLPFPAVTVCDRKEAKALSDVVAEEIKKDKDWNETETYLKWYCDSSPEGREAYLSGHEGYHKFLNRMTFSCDDLFNYVEFNGMRVGKTKGDLIYRNNECCTFNAVRPEFMFKNISNSAVFNRSEFIIPGVDWNLHTGYPPKTRARTVPLRPNGSDIHSGLIFRLRFKPYCSEETLSKLDFDLYIHSPTEPYTIHLQNLRILTANRYYFSVTPRMTDSADSIRSVKPEKRGCYFDDEKVLDYFKRYSKEKCEMNIEQNMLYDRCRCLSSYLSGLYNKSTCDKYSLCYKNTIYKYLNQNSGYRADCLPECSTLTYSVIEKSESYFTKEEAEVSIFLVESNIHGFYRSEFLSFNGFVANIGGLLGLFLGFSFLVWWR